MADSVSSPRAWAWESLPTALAGCWSALPSAAHVLALASTAEHW